MSVWGEQQLQKGSVAEGVGIQKSHPLQAMQKRQFLYEFVDQLYASYAYLGYTPLNIHEIWPRLLLGEHLLYIRAKMTSFVNSLD